MHAIFSIVLGIEPRETLPHLKSALRGIYKRVYRDVLGASQRLQKLRQGAGLGTQDAVALPT